MRGSSLGFHFCPECGCVAYWRSLEPDKEGRRRIAVNLRLIGVMHPQELAAKDALQLYQALCRATGQRQDPCVLDTFMAATDFMRGAAAKPWWDYTAQRKAQYGTV